MVFSDSSVRDLHKRTDSKTQRRTCRLAGSHGLLSVITARSFEKLGDSATRFDVYPTAIRPVCRGQFGLRRICQEGSRYCDSDSLPVAPDSPKR